MKKRYFFKAFIICGLWTVVCGLNHCYAFSLTDAHRDYIRGDYEEAIGKARSLKETDKTLYFLGLVYIKTGNYSKARPFFRKLIKSFPNSGFCGQGMIKLADTYFLQKDYSNAWELYKGIEERRPSLNNMPLVLLRLAQIASRQGNWEEKKKYLKLIKKKYPESSEIKFVSVLEEWGDFFIIQVGAFSDKKNALSLRAELEKDYHVYIAEDKKGSFPLYKVRVGKFKDRYETQKVFLKLRDEGYPARIYP